MKFKGGGGVEIVNFLLILLKVRDIDDRQKKVGIKL